MNSMMTQGARIFRKLRFSRCYPTSSEFSSNISRSRSSPFFPRSHNSRTIRTSSLTRTCSNFSDAFSEENKDRLVRQLGKMRTPKSLLARCSEEAAVFVPFCLVNSVPSVLFTLRSSQLNSHKGEVRLVANLLRSPSYLSVNHDNNQWLLWRQR